MRGNLILLILVFLYSSEGISLWRSQDPLHECGLKCEPCRDLSESYENYDSRGCPTSCKCIHDSEMLFEGDIVLQGKTLKAANIAYGIGGSSSITTKDESHALTNRINLLWPRKGEVVVVPYVLDKNLEESQRKALKNAISEYDAKTCIRFQRRKNEKDYLHIFLRTGCWSLVGKVGGRQNISLGWGCEDTGLVIHELMHSIGFWHEQSRPDRDDYVTIKFENIQPRMVRQFQKRAEVDSRGYPYDYNSIMHYPDHAFGKKAGLKTIVPKESGIYIGQRFGFSKIDLLQINDIYCKGTEHEVSKNEKLEAIKSSGGCDKAEGCNNFDETISTMKKKLKIYKETTKTLLDYILRKIKMRN